MIYKHTQFSPLFFCIAVLMLTFFIFLLATEDLGFLIFSLQFVVIFILFSFSFLTVEIDNTELKIKFGYGLYRKIFKLKDIKSVKKVRNKWYYGWGVRYIFNPFMIIYNVFGLDAVEFNTKDKKIFRVGTNEPDKLEKILQKAIT